MYNRSASFIGLVFQTMPMLFQVFFRHGFGRRSLVGSSLPLAGPIIVAVAVLVRFLAPQAVVYFPLRYLPPFGSNPANQAFFTSGKSLLPMNETLFFAGFAALVFVASLVHYIRLVVQRWRKIDPQNTKFWGESWLAAIPLMRRVPLRVIQSVIEPGIVLIAGYAFCFFAPVFGMYLLAGGLALGIEQASSWNARAKAELDARDALVVAKGDQEIHEAAQEHGARAARARNAAISSKTVARVQKTPHAMLALSEEELAAVRDQLGSERFGELVDQLEPSAQQAVYGRMVGLTSVPERQRESA